ncbi:hypothetical protein D3C72_1758400 [compost metagenome]
MHRQLAQVQAPCSRQRAHAQAAIPHQPPRFGAPRGNAARYLQRRWFGLDRQRCVIPQFHIKICQPHRHLARCGFVLVGDTGALYCNARELYIPRLVCRGVLGGGLFRVLFQLF